ncbi:MAG: hypothetical protein CH6_0115 [Candidatus Kapaibacterium sp.]|nr:MAG: hypothetical protein CH6_0115 [Candidatus Kapabacteria bacterium]
MYQDRIDLYKEIEKKQNSKLIVYVTSDRGGFEGQISQDILPIFTEHLNKIGKTKKISLYIYTQGGEFCAAWSLVNLIRSYCKVFEVIVPFRCLSAGTLICLGADKIIMTKQALLGPIDPSLNGSLNPISPINPGVPIPVSAEAINAYLEIAKKELGIKDPIALSNILIDLAQKVHPIVLGQVFRLRAQIQMLARRLLRHQNLKQGQIEKIVKFLCSESGSHDYTINRKEAKNELGLNIEKPDDNFYQLIKKVYDNICQELELLSPWNINLFLGNENEKEFCFRRALIESIEYGSNVFVSEGKYIRENGQITTKLDYDGWKYLV